MEDLEDKLKKAYAQQVSETSNGPSGGQGGSGGMDTEAMIQSSVNSFMDGLGSSWKEDLRN